MARESIATLNNCSNPLIWSQIRMELLGKVELSPQSVEALLITRAGAVLMAGTQVQVEAEANRLCELNTHHWAENYNLCYSLRSAVEWLTGRNMYISAIPKICIKSNGVHLEDFIKGMTGKDTYSGDGQVREAYRIDNGEYLRRATWDNLNSASYAAYTKLDANNPADLNRLRTMLGFKPINMDKPDTVTTIEQCISNGLKQFIQSNPQDEMVLGFLLKETGMRLTKEVQAAGLESIAKFIIDETNANLVKQFERYKAGEVATPKLPEPASNTKKVFFTETQFVRGTMRFTRNDEQRRMAEVPIGVWEQAVNEGDESRIWDWINDNDAGEPQGEVSQGDEEFGDNISEEIDDAENGRMENADGTRLVLQ